MSMTPSDLGPKAATHASTRLLGRPTTQPAQTTLETYLHTQQRSTISRAELESLDFSGYHIRKWVQEQVLERVVHGMYQLNTLPQFNFEDLKQVQLSVPKGIFCLITALEIHGLTTQKAHTIHLAVPVNTWKPNLANMQVEYHSFADGIYRFGIETREEGLRVYSLEKTLTDLLHHRNKVGIEIFKEALEAYLKTRKPNFNLLMDAARVCKVEHRMRDLLEVLV